MECGIMTDCEKAEQFVCISCVEEVRYSFVSHLSEAIRRKGINYVVVGVDSDDVLSKESQAKVEKARVSVMVLPGNCEPTTVCLDKFLECQRNNDQVVIPVLYGDSPLQGEWLTALDSRELSPLHQSRKECSDSKLVEEIVRDVYEKLFHMGRIGIYSKLLEIENMVCKQPFGIRRVGIWGMPGIGKTTLAKAVFDQMSGYFDAKCFIEDYEKAVHEKGIYLLLEEQLFKENPGTGDTITKPSLLTDKSSSKRVLVVLDDVRNPLVAQSFFEGFDWFSPESLIIITSRDKQVFRLCRINQIYEVQGLNEKEALQLFFLCASIKDMGEQNLHELSVKVINYANGNPLAISIYGRELKGKKRPPEMEMETAFLELKRRPPSEIVDVVKSSYDTLSDSEKNIFLDVACFFQGENVDCVMQLLEGCGFFPHVGIDVLVEKCLVTISESRVRMHNLTREVGREIIKRETVQSRLWEPQSIKYLLEDNEPQGTEEIEGMFLDTSNLSFDIKSDAFEHMLNLRLLKIYCSNPEIRPVINFPEGLLHSLPNELRLLHWENYPLESLPQNFDPRHLVEINMPYSQLQKLWGGTKNMEMLKTIRLSHSRHLVDIDDILKAPNLEVVDLQGCIKLQSFPSTGQLLHLRVLNLSGCTEIKKFPEIPPNIKTLHLQGTDIRKLPLSIVKPNEGKLVNLLAEFPGLSDALKLELTSLAKSSSSSQDLGKLICLDLKDCSRLQSLPNMGNLEFLKVLDLSGCSELETIQGFPQNLKELYIAGAAVREMPQLPQSLELLYAHGCVSLKSICLDREHFPMHYTFSNCFGLSPQVVSEFLVKVLDNVKHIPREHPQELNEALAFSFCAPSQANQDSTLDLQLGSSVMRRLNPSWRNTLVGFAILVEVAFSEDYSDATGFSISCVCRWKNKEGHSHRIERNLHCWAAGKAAPKVQKDHMFVFCDAKMRLSTGERNDPNILADLVVFEFFPVHKQTKCLDDTCTVTRCGVCVINAPTGNTSLEHISAGLSLDPVEFSGNGVKEVLRVSYDGLQEIYKALFLYIACLFNDEDFALVAPLMASIDVDISSGLKALANRSLIRVSSNGEIVMHCLLRQMGKEILHKQSRLPGSSKDLTRDFEKDSMASSSSRNWKCDVFLSFSGQDVSKEFLSHFLVACEHKLIITFKNNETDKGKLSSPLLVQAIRKSRISIVVFSKEYASSSWLLNELVEIAKCKQEFGQIVIPIFYNVDPSEVRQQTGEFGRHFKQTYKGLSEDKKQQWQRALMDISNIVGYHIANWDREASMIEKKNVIDVSNKLVSFGFRPTDLEIVYHYLRPKNLGSDTSDVDKVISTVDIYSFDPWELPTQSRRKSTDQVWYFFGCRKEQHNINRGDRQSRKTKSGFWKKTGVTMDIMRKRSGNRDKIGEKTVLVFHFSKILGGSKSNWVMHEYHATFLSPPNQMMTTYTICKLMFKGDEREMFRDHEASMIEKIVIDVSNKLGRTTSIEVSNKLGCTPSIDFAKMNSLLCLESEEVKMVGIWGPSGIGKSTIARFLYDEISSEFEVSAFVDLLRDGYNQRGHMDGYGGKLYLQQLVLSQILNQADIKINHLGVMQERLKDQKVLIILDGVDDQLQLDALAGNIRWFGPGSRIIVITKDLRLLKVHGINYIYEMGLPSRKQALQMLCQYAFGQNSPRDGFMELATEVAESAGNLPLGLRVFGSYLRGMHKEQWLKALPRIRNSLGGEIESILKFGYDGLCDEDKDLFLYISCLFNHGTVEDLTRLLTSCFLDVEHRLTILAEKSIIDISEHGNVTMHHLQQQLGREIVRRECIQPGKRRFLVDCLDICNVLAENTGTRSVVGISLDMSESKELLISERGFNEMINLQFLKFYTKLGDKEVKVRLPHGLDYLSHKLRLLHWEGFPMSCMPSNFIPNYLVEITMVASKLEELWSGIQPLESLKCINLRGSLDLRHIPDLTYATNLETLDLGGCSSLTKLPSSIGHLHKLKGLDMERCTHLEVLPTGINLESLDYLNLNGCSRLTSFPDISRSISDLYLDGTAIEEVPWWIENISGLSYLSMNGCNKLQKISPNISKLKLLVEVDFSECRALTEDSWQNHHEEISTSLMKVNISGNSFERLPDTWTSIQPKYLDLGNCRNLVSLPELPASLSILTANYCESLESLYGSFHPPQMTLQFINCFKLNHQAREFILHSDCAYAILPGGELPAYFTHRVDGNFLTVTLPRISLSRKILSFKACMVVESRVCWFDFGVIWLFRGGKDNKYFSYSTNIYSKRNHLIIFNFEFSLDGVNDPPAELNYGDVQFEFFCLDHTKAMIQIKECGIRLLEVSPSLDDSRKSSETEDDDKSGENDAEASRSRKKMRIT